MKIIEDNVEDGNQNSMNFTSRPFLDASRNSINTGKHFIEEEKAEST